VLALTRLAGTPIPESVAQDAIGKTTSRLTPDTIERRFHAHGALQFTTLHPGEFFDLLPTNAPAWQAAITQKH